MKLSFRIGAAVVACAVGLSMAQATPAVAKAPLPVAWGAHAKSVRGGHTVVLTLGRRVRAACSLGVRSPSGVAKRWSYDAGRGALKFAVHPTSATRRGAWVFTASCKPQGQAKRVAVTTKLNVVTGKSARGFLFSRTGPAYMAPVSKGSVARPRNLPVGGRGGDPGNDYPWANRGQDSGLDPWGEYLRECTSFVAWALHSRNQFDMPFHANAYEWGNIARQRGYAVNSTPAIGAVAWEAQRPGHYWGHVAWVSNVSGGSVTIEEYNEHGNGTYDVRTVPAGTFQYIHFKDLTYNPPTVPTPAPPTAPPASSPNHQETTGSVANTWTDYTNAGGTHGPSIPAQVSVQISCKLTGFRVADGNTWWYQIASSPWDNSYYVSADAFYNNGATSGSLHGTPFVDGAVPDCSSGGAAPPPPPPSTRGETTGSVAHTWTNYSNAGGSQGPSIASNQTVQISCKITGFRVADGNTWWYRIAQSPWSDQYYVSADAFYNNGATSGSLHGTPFVDGAVPDC